MLKIQIANTEFEYLDALETEQFFNGSSRRTLTVTCAPNVISVDTLNALLTEENLASVRLTNTEGIPVTVVDDMGQTVVDHYDPIVTIHEGYVLKLSCGIQNMLVKAETTDSAAVYEDRLVFKMGKRTYIEQMLKELGL